MNDTRLAIILEGGVVQSVICDDPTAVQRVRIMILEYDLEPSDCNARIVSPDGESSELIHMSRMTPEVSGLFEHDIELLNGRTP